MRRLPQPLVAVLVVHVHLASQVKGEWQWRAHEREYIERLAVAIVDPLAPGEGARHARRTISLSAMRNNCAAKTIEKKAREKGGVDTCSMCETGWK